MKRVCVKRGLRVITLSFDPELILHINLAEATVNEKTLQ